MRRAVERRIAVFGGISNFSCAPARYDHRELGLAEPARELATRPTRAVFRTARRLLARRLSTEGERRLFRVRVPAGHVTGQTLKVELPDSVKAFYEAE